MRAYCLEGFGGFSELGVPLFFALGGSSYNKDYRSLGSIQGPPKLGNYHLLFGVVGVSATRTTQLLSPLNTANRGCASSLTTTILPNQTRNTRM